MQTCTKWKACYLCVMLRFWKNCHYLYLNCKMFPKPTLHRWQIRSSLGVFDHLPVSIGSLMLLHLNFVIMFLSCGNNFNKYFSKFNSFFEKKLSCILYKIMFNLSIIDNVQIKWLNFIKSIFEKTGLNYLWNQQQPSSSFYWKLNGIASKLCYHVSLMW
jgi:hypothetical protein